MDENKFVEFKTNISKEKSEKKNHKFSFQTNPILQKMFLTNMNNENGKFKFKDLFR